MSSLKCFDLLPQVHTVQQWCTDMEILQSDWIRTFSYTPYPIRIRKFKIINSDIQSKSETAHSAAH